MFTLQKLLVLPTWLIYLIGRRWLRPDHPWHGKNFTLENWTLGSTKLTKQFAWLFWLQIACLTFVVIIIVKRHVL